MVGGGQGSSDARASAEINSGLMKQFAGIGQPALAGVLGYTRGALKQGGLPGYVEAAYRQASSGALEQQAQGLTGLRRTLASRTGGAESGGAYLQGISDVASSGGDAYAREMAGIRTSRAVAGIEQRNKLLGVLAGAGATSTDLSAAFGGLGNRAISLEGQDNGMFGGITGGLSAGLGLFASLSQNQTNRSGILGFNPNATGAYNSQLGAYQGGGGTIDLTTRP